MKKLLFIFIGILLTDAAIAECSSCNSCGSTSNGVKKTYVLKKSSDYRPIEYADIKPVAEYQSDYVMVPEYTEPVRYEYAEPVRAEYFVKRDWYIAAHANLSLLSFTSEQNSFTYPLADSFIDDDYSFEPVFGFDVAVGHEFTDNISADLELGYMGQFIDSGDSSIFKLKTPYALINGYYTFDNNVYLGVGFGGTLLKSKLENDIFVNDATKTKFSLMVAGNVGYTYAINNSLALDLRYRLAYMDGIGSGTAFMIGEAFTDSMTGITVPVGKYDYSYEIDHVIDNMFSVGLRYRF